MHNSIDPWRRSVSDEKLSKVLKMYNENFSDDIGNVENLRDSDNYGALGLARLLVIPDNKEPIDHIRDLSLAARYGYEANATRDADIQHSAARILASYYEFDWKEDIIAHEDEREGELGTE